MRCGLTSAAATLRQGLAWLGQHADTERISAVRVGLMAPCYIDMFYPQVGVATPELLEKLGVGVDYSCEQAMSERNDGCH
jgi:Fe-S oxidoreductase